MRVSDHAVSDVINILEWIEDRDALAWHLPCSNEIKYGARLMVHDFQQAIFCVNNTIADIYNPGLYTLTRENMPRMSVLSHWDDRFHESFRADIYFIKTKYFIEQPWTIRSEQSAKSRLMLCGTYDVKVINARKLIQKMVSEPTFKIAQVTQLVEKMVDGMLPHTTKDNTVEAAADENVDFAGFLQESINIELNNYGLLIRNLTIKLFDPKTA